MARRAPFLLCLMLLSSFCLLHGQDEIPTQVTVQNRSGELPFSSTVGTDVEYVDATGGGLHVSIPILHVPGRGMNYDFGLYYDARFWVSATRSAGGQNFEVWNIEQGGLWNTSVPYVTNTSDSTYCNSFDQFFGGPTGTLTEWTNYIYHDASGAKHPVALIHQDAACNEGNYSITNATEPDASASGMLAIMNTDPATGFGIVKAIDLANGTQILPFNSVLAPNEIGRA